MVTILLPTDFSENSMNATKYALEFFKYQKAEFYFMHAYQNEVYDHDKLFSREVFEDILDNVRNASRKNLEKLLTEVEKIAPNPRYKYHIISSYSTLVEEASLIANAKNIDLIVMGTKGKTNEGHNIFGSNTYNVLKYVKCPVLAVPAKYNNIQPRRILFPTDYMISYKRRELKLLCDLAASYRSFIDVLYVSKSKKLSMRQEDNQTFIKETLDKTQVVFHLENSNKIAETIQHYIKNKEIDMLVMVNTHHSFLENMLFDSTIDKVSLNLQVPLLAMQNSTRTL